MDYVSVGRLRTQGYLRGLEINKMEPDSNLILKIDDAINVENHVEILEREIQKFLELNPGIDAIFAVNELYAVTAMKVAKKLGRNIPEDIQVIGFTDGVLSKHATPSLTTVSQHGQKIGEQAANLLINRLESEDYGYDPYGINNSPESDFIKLVIETEIIERESTK